MEVESVIIGGGPAGLQLAYCFEQRNIPYILLERSSTVGSFFEHYPRQRQLISINKSNSLSVSHDNSLRYDWNTLLCSDSNFKFSNYTDKFYPDASLYVQYLDDFSTRFKLNVELNTHVSLVRKNAFGKFEICLGPTRRHAYTCKRLFMACGLTEKEVPQDIQEATASIGATLSTYGTMSLDPELYKQKSVVIIGTGNAAFETANYLNDFTESIAMVGPSKVAWKTHYPGHLRSKNMAFIDTLYLKMGNIIYYDDYHAASVIYTQHVFLQHSHSKVHYVIYCGGFKCELSFLDESCRPVIDEKSAYPTLNETFESSVPNMYFIGASMQSPDWKKGTSSFIHGFRYNIKFLDRVLNDDLRALHFTTRESLETHINIRINESSCLHHRHKWFCDVLIIENNTSFYYFEDIYLPFYRARQEMFRRIATSATTVTTVLIYMDYGAEFEWSLKQKGSPNQPDIIMPFRDAISKFLHPVFEVHMENKNSHSSHTFHVGESPSGQFHHPIYQQMVSIYLDFALGNGSDRDVSIVECNMIQLEYDYGEYMKYIVSGSGGPFISNRVSLTKRTG